MKNPEILSKINARIYEDANIQTPDSSPAAAYSATDSHSWPASFRRLWQLPAATSSDFRSATGRTIVWRVHFRPHDLRIAYARLWPPRLLRRRHMDHGLS